MKPSPAGEGLGEEKSTQEKIFLYSLHPGLLRKGEEEIIPVRLSSV